MIHWFKQLDRLLRGDATRPEALLGGTIDISAGGLAVVGILLGVVYGLCMGVFSLTGSGSGERVQIMASAIKVPALFFLTLLVTFPSLYVFNALVGSRLGPLAVLRLLTATIGIMTAVLASLGPIVAFFSLTTTSYPFTLLLNVLVFSIAGFLGGGFLLRTLQRLTVALEMVMEAERRTAAPPPLAAVSPFPATDPSLIPSVTAHSETVSTPTAGPSATGPKIPTNAEDPWAGFRSPMALPPRMPAANVRTVFQIWILVFGLVGAQMSWIMRPFIGNPNMPFHWLRPTSSNFFEAVAAALKNLF